MATEVQIIRTLHRILRQQADIRSQLERGPRTIKAAQANSDAAVKALNDHKELIKQKRMDADRKQLQLRGRETKIFELEGKMNMSKNNREYQMLKEQIAADKQANAVLSDEILETLEEIDVLVSQTPSLEEKRRLIEAESQKIEAHVEQRKASLESDLARITGDLAETEKTLTGDIKVTYLRLVAGRKEEAMAELEDNSCSNCNTNMPPRAIDRLRMDETVLCGSCGCLVYPKER